MTAFRYLLALPLDAAGVGLTICIAPTFRRVATFSRNARKANWTIPVEGTAWHRSTLTVHTERIRRAIVGLNALRLWNAAAVLTDLASIAVTTRETQIIVHTDPVLADFTRLTIGECRAFGEI